MFESPKQHYLGYRYFKDSTSNIWRHVNLRSGASTDQRALWDRRTMRSLKLWGLHGPPYEGYCLLGCELSSKLHGVTSQKTVIYGFSVLCETWHWQASGSRVFWLVCEYCLRLERPWRESLPVFFLINLLLTSMFHYKKQYYMLRGFLCNSSNSC